jgi:GNAT superfamily N-acetyltransferase
MFAPPRGFFLIGRIGSDADLVGGVGLRPHNETVGEVKRLWVDPTRRGHGFGLALMGHLETTARDLGYAELRLETGPKQPEAVSLYGASGWTRRDGPWDTNGCLPDGVIRFFKDLR